MGKRGLLIVTDRGGHLHNARMLVDQLGVIPEAWLVTSGPDKQAFEASGQRVIRLPYLFSWVGKRRLVNPLKIFWAFCVAAFWALRLRPRQVISLGASDVVPFCFWAWVIRARVFHVECMNQVRTASVTGRLLYPVCTALYVQWPELLQAFGPRARYRGWVLSHSLFNEAGAGA